MFVIRYRNLDGKWQTAKNRRGQTALYDSRHKAAADVAKWPPFGWTKAKVVNATKSHLAAMSPEAAKEAAGLGGA